MAMEMAMDMAMEMAMELLMDMAMEMVMEPINRDGAAGHGIATPGAKAAVATMAVAGETKGKAAVAKAKATVAAL